MTGSSSSGAHAASATDPGVSTSGALRGLGTTMQGILLLLGSCMPVLGAVLLSPVLPTMAAHFADTPGVAILVPMVLTVPALFVALVSPVAGAVADKVGRKNLLLWAMVAYAVFGMAPFFMDSLVQIVVTRAFVGVCEAFIMTCCTTLIGDYFHETRRNKYLSLQTVFTTVSAVAFLTIGGLLGAGGWRNTFWMYGVAVVLAAIMLPVLWEPVKNPTRNLRQAVPWRQLSKPAVVTLFGGIAFYTLVVHLSYILTDLGLSDVARIGMMSALASLATAVGAFSFRLVGGFGPYRLLPIAFGLTSVGFVVIWGASSIPVAMAGAVFASAGTGLLLPSLITWALGVLPQEVRGTGTGIWTSSLWIGQFICPFVVAALGAAAGGLAAGIGILGLLAAVMAAVSFFTAGRPVKANSVTQATA
ncbi:MFS transporter [Arthrobacter jiangjiafuii]|nr:MFS transporter [Arthrobacter jiangjiafuii]